MTKRAQNTREFTFRMDSYSISTLPMNRLAEYMADLATILGEHKHVHFKRLQRGSVAVKVVVENEAEPKVRNRIRLCKSGEGPPEARTAQRNMNKRLAEDNASGVLLDPNEKVIIPFPGKKEFAAPRIGPIRQPGTLDGVPIRVGGKGDTVPVHLEGLEKEIYVCEAKREIAQQVAKHIFQTPLRADGTGSWERGADGEWEMKSFSIQSFEVMKHVPLSETVNRLRAVELPVEPGENLLETMRDIRNGS